MDDQARARAGLPDRGAGDLPPQELLLPRQSEGVPDLPVRRAAVPGRSAGRPWRERQGGRDRPCAPRGGRGEERPPRNRRGPHLRGERDPRRLQPGRHAAGRDRHAAGPPLRRRGPPVPPAAPPDRRRARDLRRRDGEGVASVRRQRLRSAGGLRRASNSHRAEEPELVRVRRPGDRARGRAPDRDLRGRGRGRAGDAALRPGQGVRAADALEGGGAGLPLLPRARSRPDRAAGRAGRARPQRAARSFRAPGSTVSPTSSITPPPRISSRVGGTRSTSGCRETGGRSRTC